MKFTQVLFLLLFISSSFLYSDSKESSQKRPWWKKFKDIVVPESVNKSNQIKDEKTDTQEAEKKETSSNHSIKEEDVTPLKHSAKHENNKNSRLIIPTVKNEELKRWGIRLDISLLDPDIDEWSTYYEDNMVFNYGLEGQYYFNENWSLNLGLNYLETDGVGVLGNTAAIGTNVKYRLIPYHFGTQYEFIYNNTPFVRPYLGAGYAYAQYTQTPDSGSKIKGHEDGYYLNLGCMFNFYYLKEVQHPEDSYYKNTYWILEAERLWLKSDQVDLGGLNYSLGVKVRF